MQNNFSQEGDTSNVSSKAGEGCYGSQSKVYPVIFHLLLADGASSAWEKQSEKENQQVVRHGAPVRKIQPRNFHFCLVGKKSRLEGRRKGVEDRRAGQNSTGDQGGRFHSL